MLDFDYSHTSWRKISNEIIDSVKNGSSFNFQPRLLIFLILKSWHPWQIGYHDSKERSMANL